MFHIMSDQGLPERPDDRSFDDHSTTTWPRCRSGIIDHHFQWVLWCIVDDVFDECDIIRVKAILGSVQADDPHGAASRRIVYLGFAKIVNRDSTEMTLRY